MHRHLKTILFLLLPVLFLSACGHRQLKDLKEGDILFQSSSSRQAKAIELATHSAFSHCGVVLKKDGQLMVFEAVGPVKFTPVARWIAHGKGGRFTLMRLKSSPPDSVLNKMEAAVPQYQGKNYDAYFGWSDDEIYCSELVWKVYHDAGITLCPLKKFRDYDFSNPLVRAKIKERYGDKLPLDEQIVSPEDLSKSTLLEKVNED